MNKKLTAQERIQTFPTDALVAAANGQINLNQIAREELAQRGLIQQGQWVGFLNAHKILRTAECISVDARIPVAQLVAAVTAAGFKVVATPDGLQIRPQE